MAKAPAMQFYVKDWKADTDGLSVAAKGAWIQCIATLHLSQKRGVERRSLAAWARVFGCTPEEADTLLHEIKASGCGHVTFRNGDVTVLSRRIDRERKAKEANRMRVSRHRAKRGSNENVTSPSSSASASAITIKDCNGDETPPYAGPDKPIADASQVAKATAHLRDQFRIARQKDNDIPVLARFDTWVQQVIRDGGCHNGGADYALSIMAADFTTAFASYLDRQNTAVTWSGTWVQNARNDRLAAPPPQAKRKGIANDGT